MYIQRQAILDSLSDENRAEFESYIRQYETPLERVHRNVVNKYFRAYWAVNDIITRTYTPDEQKLIAEFYDPATSLARKEEIRQVRSSKSSRQLIAEFQDITSTARQALRETQPQLDFYLYVFGYTQSARTPEARALIDSWESDRYSLTEGY
jgi:hypothetical protein